MGDIADQGNDWLRDFVTDGVPSSGPNDPEKSAGRALFTLIEGVIADVGASHSGTTAPSDAVYGTMWMDVGHDELKIYDGASWITLFTVDETAHTAALAATVELPAAIQFLGDWSSGTTYAVGDSVSYDGGSYVSRVASNLNHQPDTSTTQWQIIAAQGDAGAGTVDKYVSETDGSDSGAGTYDDPYQTWAKGYAETPAGATMWLFGTPENPQEYFDSGASSTDIDKEITVRAINKGGAIVRSNGATNTALNIAPSGGETINLIGLIIDPSGNSSASSLLYTISLTSQTSAYRLNCIDCTFRGWTGASAYGVYTTAANFKGYLSFKNCTFAGDDIRGALTIDQLIEGGVEVEGGSIVLTDQNLQSYGPIKIVGKAAGVTASVVGVTVTTTVKASLTGNSQHLGVYIEGVAGARIAKCPVRLLGPGSPRGSAAIRIVTNGAGDSTELPIDGSIIEDNDIYCEPSGGGIACGFGNDGSGDNAKMVGCISRRNKIRASVAAGAAGLHGEFAGRCRNHQSYGNDVNCGGLNYVRKNCDGTLDDYDNDSRGATSSSFLYKSVAITGGRCQDNRAILTPASGVNTAIALTQDVTGSGPYTSGITINGYEVQNNGATGAVMVDIETGSSGAFTGNAYANIMGTLATNVFRDGATNYTAFGAWQAAVGTTDVANFA